jgi:hypothetical protein
MMLAALAAANRLRKTRGPRKTGGPSKARAEPNSA